MRFNTVPCSNCGREMTVGAYVDRAPWSCIGYMILINDVDKYFCAECLMKLRKEAKNASANK